MITIESLNDILDTNQSAEYLEISPESVRALFQDNIIPSKRVGFNYVTIKTFLDNYRKNRLEQSETFEAVTN